MSHTIPPAERLFASLIRSARSAGITVDLRDDANCRVLVVPTRKHITISLQVPVEERTRLLVAALRHFGLGPPAELVRETSASIAAAPGADPASTDPPTLSAAIPIDVAPTTSKDERPTRRLPLNASLLTAASRSDGSELADAIVDDCAETLRDDTTRITRDAVARHIEAMQPPRTLPTRCELCEHKWYGQIGPMSLCRSHLYAAVQGRLLPGEVLALRGRHGMHPEVADTRYDAWGELC